MGVSKNNGTPKSSILMEFSIINHPFWGTKIFGNIHIDSHDSLCFYAVKLSCRKASFLKVFPEKKKQPKESPRFLIETTDGTPCFLANLCIFGASNSGFPACIKHKSYTVSEVPMSIRMVNGLSKLPR